MPALDKGKVAIPIQEAACAPMVHAGVHCRVLPNLGSKAGTRATRVLLGSKLNGGRWEFFIKIDHFNIAQNPVFIIDKSIVAGDIQAHNISAL